MYQNSAFAGRLTDRLFMPVCIAAETFLISAIWWTTALLDQRRLMNGLTADLAAIRTVSMGDN